MPGPETRTQRLHTGPAGDSNRGVVYSWHKLHKAGPATDGLVRLRAAIGRFSAPPNEPRARKGRVKHGSPLHGRGSGPLIGYVLRAERKRFWLLVGSRLWRFDLCSGLFPTDAFQQPGKNNYPYQRRDQQVHVVTHGNHK